MFSFKDTHSAFSNAFSISETLSWPNLDPGILSLPLLTHQSSMKTLLIRSALVVLVTRGWFRALLCSFFSGCFPQIIGVKLTVVRLRWGKTNSRRIREFNEGTKQNPRLFLSVFSSCWFLILTLGCPLESTEELKKKKKNTRYLDYTPRKSDLTTWDKAWASGFGVLQVILICS